MNTQNQLETIDKIPLPIYELILIEDQTKFPYQDDSADLDPWTEEEVLLDPMTGDEKIHPVGELLRD